MEIASIKERVVPVLRRSGVSRAALFGSTVKKNKTPNDVDILVELDKKISLLGFINLKHRLEKILDQKVDLVEYDTLKSELKERILAEQVNLI